MNCKFKRVDLGETLGIFIIKNTYLKFRFKETCTVMFITMLVIIKIKIWKQPVSINSGIEKPVDAT